ncbi:MAG: phosphoribosylaminoimidazolesuccinocarboxamide synthase [Flavobacteriales bacterium]|jgi:phosphoribosylaminoimidazole-succinocarboxamide synthase
MKEALKNHEFNFKGQTSVYHGKVRDVYSLNDGRLIMVASDRISAFDHILPRPIPFKGQVLNQVATYFLKATADIVPNWLLATPDANVSVGVECEPIRVEMVIRGYLAGHAAREYHLGKRLLCGVKMPEGMKENDAFPVPIITPAVKAAEGHDEDISREDILAHGHVPEAIYLQMEAYTRALFARGTQMAKERGLILVDTKYEFGLKDGQVILIDEIHTPDSSRYFYADGYEERQRNGEPQKQLSKEFVRQWLIEQGFQGLEGQQMPVMPDDFVELVSQRYIELYEKITGEAFIKDSQEDMIARINNNVSQYLMA